jgi:hypothetical protein
MVVPLNDIVVWTIVKNPADRAGPWYYPGAQHEALVSQASAGRYQRVALAVAHLRHALTFRSPIRFTGNMFMHRPNSDQDSRLKLISQDSGRNQFFHRLAERARAVGDEQLGPRIGDRDRAGATPVDLKAVGVDPERRRVLLGDSDIRSSSPVRRRARTRRPRAG